MISTVPLDVTGFASRICNAILAAYAAAGIADTPPNATGWQAALLGIPVLIIPLIFFWRPSLLLIGTAGDIVTAVVLTFAAIVALSAMTIGWFLRPLAVWQRLVLGLLGIGTVVPLHNVSHISLAAIAIVVALLALQRHKLRRVSA
jgi:TRAP-type uncharacterized transport system fused permease subunit